MAKQIDWSGWKEISDPPTWVKRAASKWYHNQKYRPYDKVKHFVGRHFVYRVWFEMKGQGQTQWHFYRIAKIKKPRPNHYHRKEKSRAPLIAIVILLAVLGGFLVFSPSTVYSAFNDTSESLNSTLSKISEQTIENYETSPLSQTYSYTLDGKKVIIPYTLYGGVNSHLSTNKPNFYGNYQDYYLDFLDQNIQKDYLSGLADQIRSETSDTDNQARIAISLVQNIPYDYAKLNNLTPTTRYPYEVLYDKRGVCEEKSLLTAFLLRELGFGVALFEFPSENHMTVGISVPMQYAYKGSGYAFVETTRPTIITDSENDYIGVGRLTSNPTIIKISDGRSFESVSEEFSDAQEWQEIASLGTVLDQYHYSRWQSLAKKYGITFDT